MRGEIFEYGYHGHRALICLINDNMVGGNLSFRKENEILWDRTEQYNRETFRNSTMTIWSRLKLRCWSN